MNYHPDKRPYIQHHYSLSCICIHDRLHHYHTVFSSLTSVLFIVMSISLIPPVQLYHVKAFWTTMHKITKMYITMPRKGYSIIHLKTSLGCQWYNKDQYAITRRDWIT